MHVLCVSTVQIVALFKVLVSLPRVDARGTQPRLYGVSIEICRTVDMTVQLCPYMASLGPHSRAVMPDVVSPRAEMPHL